MTNPDIRKTIDDSIGVLGTLHDQEHLLVQASDLICERLNFDKKLLIFGNGGSAADAQHIAGELVGRFRDKRKRKGLAAIALTTDTSILTAWSNDYEFSGVFERQVESLAHFSDVLFAISTSGDSENVVRALKKGRDIGTYNISLTGGNGGIIKGLSDININIRSYDTPRIQEAHRVAYHIICELIEKRYLPQD